MNAQMSVDLWVGDCVLRCVHSIQTRTFAGLFTFTAEVLQIISKRMP
jgi:hypothetical protein